MLGSLGVRLAEIVLRPLLILDARLHILVVKIEVAEAVIGAVAAVVIGEYGLESCFLALGIFLVVDLLLRQVLLDLLHISIPLGRGGEHTGDVQRLEVGISHKLLRLHGLEQQEVFDRVIDRRRGKDGVEASGCGGSIVLFEDGLNHGPFGDCFAGPRWVGALGFVVVDVEAQNIAILNRMGDCVGVELLLE